MSQAATHSPESEPEAEPAPDIAAASQTRLMWLRFKRHRMAMASMILLIFFYFIALFCEFFAPYDPAKRDIQHLSSPPMGIHFFDLEGNFHLRPFVYAYEQQVDEEGWQRTYSIITREETPEGVKGYPGGKRYPIQLFPKGDPYKLWNLIPMDRHFFGADGGPVYLLGADRLGRGVFSRIVYGARISLTIGLIGVGLTFLLGILLGGLAGYFGGFVDNAVQRTIEVLMSIPELPLWMALSASLPAYWSPIQIYFGITIILSLLGWTGLARVVRGKFLSLRDEDFVIAAQLAGTSEVKIIFRHLLPSFLSHVITAATLAVPAMILGETALSFLGIGLRPPVISWGVLLQQAQNYQTVAMAPWLLAPGAFVIVIVLAFNLMGDGLRDAADPYSGK